ncbi:MAG: serine/threonine-protein kinase [Vicinamibacteria bacterium]
MTLSDAALDRLRAAASASASDRYEVRGEIARGGMGTVLAAFDRELLREVALKVVSDGAPAGGDRLVREARVLARLEHPGLVPVHDVGTLADGRTFYAMKWVRGSRLDRHFAGERSIPVRLRTFERICETVAFAHAHGVLHRDLKPENVMVGPFGEVLVIDWGVARIRGGTEASALSASAAGTEHGTVLGTPGYMAPEQARGEVEAVDERADVYALGAILHHLLTDAPPPADGAPAGPRRRNPAVPRPLDSICLKALAGDRALRYPSVTALSRDVSAFLSARPVEAHRETPVEWVARQAGRYRTPLLLVAVYLLVRAALIFWAR